VSITPWSPADRSTCLHCGAHVTPRFGRVFGDDRDRAHRCPECDSHRRLSRGSAAGVDVPIPDLETAAGVDVPIPDPETAAGRHGGEPDV